MAVVFGPSPDIFFMSYGRQFVSENVPQSFTDKVKSGELAPMCTSWISMDPTCRFWIARNFVTNNIYYSNNLPPNVHARLNGTPTVPKSDYISFSADRGGYFAKHVVGYGWSTDLNHTTEKEILATRDQVGHRSFDMSLRSVIFGTRGTHLIVFNSGFIAKLHGQCTRLRAALSEFNQPGWTLEHGSTLSVHNEDHYFLKFAKHGIAGVQIRANMPENMNRKFLELMKEADKTDEQRAIAAEQQAIQQILRQRRAQSLAVSQAATTPPSRISSSGSHTSLSTASWRSCRKVSF